MKSVMPSVNGRRLGQPGMYSTHQAADPFKLVGNPEQTLSRTHGRQRQIFAHARRELRIQHGHQHLVLVLEVPVDGVGRDPGGTGQAAYRGGLIAFLHKQLPGRSNNLVPLFIPVLLALDSRHPFPSCWAVEGTSDECASWALYLLLIAIQHNAGQTVSSIDGALSRVSGKSW